MSYSLKKYGIELRFNMKYIYFINKIVQADIAKVENNKTTSKQSVLMF